MIETLKIKQKEAFTVSIKGMFDGIANNYDHINSLLSFGTDIYWRKATINTLKKRQPEYILDLATGTAEMAIMAAKSLKPQKIYGLDISEEMLQIARHKVSDLKLSHIIELQSGNAMQLPFDDNSFDAVTIGFGIRNFADLVLSLKEIKRVLRKNGLVSILEFSKPNYAIVRKTYDLYMAHLMPFIGNKMAHHAFAYNYLRESIELFPAQKDIIKLINSQGFTNTRSKSLSFGITHIFTAEKS